MSWRAAGRVREGRRRLVFVPTIDCCKTPFTANDSARPGLAETWSAESTARVGGDALVSTAVCKLTHTPCTDVLVPSDAHLLLLPAARPPPAQPRRRRPRPPRQPQRRRAQPVSARLAEEALGRQPLCLLRRNVLGRLAAEARERRRRLRRRVVGARRRQPPTARQSPSRRVEGVPRGRGRAAGAAEGRRPPGERRVAPALGVARSVELLRVDEVRALKGEGGGRGGERWRCARAPMCSRRVPRRTVLSHVGW